MKKIIFTIFGFCIGLLLVACGSTTLNSSSDNSTTDTNSPTTSSTDKGITPKGVVMATVYYGEHGQNDIGNVNLSLVSPTDGRIESYKSFDFPNQTSEGKPVVAVQWSKILGNYGGGSDFFSSPFYARKGFDKDFKNMVVTFKLKDSDSDRVGILNENGELTDISAIAEGDENSFSSKKFRHEYPYIENGYFYYVSTDSTHSNAKFYRIPLDNLSQSAVEEFNPRNNRLGDTRYRKIYLDENDEYFFVAEDDGYIGNDGISTNRLKENFSDGNNLYNVTLYLGNGEYLSGLSIWRAFKEPVTGEPESYRKGAEFVRNLVPQNERRNYSPVISPDKSEILFLSKSKASNQKEPTLYKVPREGGDPEAVVQKFEPLPPSNSDLKWSDSVFLDWIG